ncbi:hypothetical protein TTHERM_00572070 (macronuclear) [Tetrahymena thermophila SB210]|uniref:Uncharacterized protein n=1 Tax=Tetrahymena thermophila (strain SB210) TaxID=312017 RepID=Q24HW7_TETTS|nr:hypothetical protein TTHERM_00572070 [Tetrahymena thermophila SB210]EAS07471.2 hypothetical protein TTHERM_00572070 [Tetrahymena thermophila SB210]|eukprot:XP_001027713.2 hypothetical protein TTHERM_00572070 [Tetrahymena thermophila SB210]
MQKKQSLKLTQIDKQEVPVLMKDQVNHQSESKEEQDCIISSEQNLEVQAKDQVKQMKLHKFIQNKEQMFDKIKQLCDESINLVDRNLFQESNYFLEQAEEIIEFAANRGKQIDRNLIITVLYNRACSYQGLWKLDKCNKYIDGVIYNLETSLKNDFWPEYENFESQIVLEKVAYKIKRQTFLVRCYLQQCAILSQLVLHEQAIQTAKKAISVLEDIYNQLLSISQDKLNQCEQTATSVITAQKQGGIFNATTQSNISKTDNKVNNSQKNLPTPKGMQSKNKFNLASSNKVFDLSGEQDNDDQINLGNSNTEADSYLGAKKSAVKEEVLFNKIILQQACSFLKTFEQKVAFETNIGDECSSQLKKARQSIYFWKNNPDNNEKNMRQELNVPTKNTDDDNRNIVGVQKSQEWIEQFNIGSIMHMTCISYDEFILFEDILFELSKKQLIEKMLLLSICFFTIATEIRFIELDKQKSFTTNSKTQQYDLYKQDAYKQSEIYHLKSIEIVCQAVTCYSPYITHLINSYHKHYNSSLELIEEEASILSQISHNNEAHDELQISCKDTTLSKNTTDILECSELQETINIIKVNNNEMPNFQKPYLAHKYTNNKVQDLQSKGSLSFNSFTNNSRSPQKQGKIRKRSPQNNQINNFSNNISSNASESAQQSKDSSENILKRPKSHHTAASQESDISPLLNNSKQSKNQAASTKKQVLALDLETINTTFGNQLNQQNNIQKVQTNKDIQNSIKKNTQPNNLLDESKRLQSKQKENLSQNNINQFSILRNYSLSNGSPRQSASNPIKTIFQGKNSQQNQQQQQGQSQQQPYLIQNQQQITNNSQSQSQQFQQHLQQQQLQLTTQQQQLLKAISNNKTNSIQLSQSQQQSLTSSQKQISYTVQQLQNSQNNGLSKTNRIFTDLDLKTINEHKSFEEKNGSQSHRSLTTPQTIQQNQNAKLSTSQINSSNHMSNSNNININGSQISNNNNNNNNLENKAATTTSLLKLQASQKNIQTSNTSNKFVKQLSGQNNQYKSLKNDINISPKQTHHFLQQFDFISSKNSNLSQQNSKEFVINSSNSTRNTQVPFNSKGIPKLDFNLIQNNPQLKAEDSIRFFSAREHQNKKINNYINK